MKQRILLLFRTQKQPKKKWNGFSMLVETKFILLSLLVFYLHASLQFCRIIYGKKSNLLSLHFYCNDARNMEIVSTLGDEARNFSLVLNTKLTKGKMEWFLHSNWDKSYSFIPICIDDAENTTNKSHDPWVLLMAPAQQQERIFAECTGVVPAKYSPNIKSELFSLL